MGEDSALLAVFNPIPKCLLRARKVVDQNRVKEQGAVCTGGMVLEPVFER
jgi:hypothetical protein